MLAVAACLEEHPDWLGEGGEIPSDSAAGTTSPSTSASNDSATTSADGASSGTSTSSDPTTVTSGATSEGTDTGVTSTPSSDGTDTVTATGSTTAATTGSVTGTNETARRIFATSTLRTGNLGGRAGADTFCQERADAAGLTGVWRALISTPAQAAAAALALTGPLENMAGETMAVDNADLWDGSLAAAVGYDEFGASATGRAWTGTAADGSATADLCDDWSTQVGGFKGTLGTATSVDATWIEGAQTGACSQSYRLYCVSD
jgi:hypothetical protein